MIYIKKPGCVGRGYIVEMETVDLSVDCNVNQIGFLPEGKKTVTISSANPGSEFDIVILVVPQSSKMLLTRNLLYTGMTRAKKLLIIIGEKNLIEFMINNSEIKKRNTGLQYRIEELI